MMSKHKPSTDPVGNDDISGLFARFGGAGDAGSYRDFDPRQLPPRPLAAPPVPPPLPVRPQAAAAVAPLRKPVPADAVEAVEAVPVAAGPTPLEAMFRRLLEQGRVPVDQEGPLKRLFSR
jgi:hypothetical protein